MAANAAQCPTGAIDDATCPRRWAGTHPCRTTCQWFCSGCPHRLTSDAALGAVAQSRYVSVVSTRPGCPPPVVYAPVVAVSVLVGCGPPIGRSRPIVHSLCLVWLLPSADLTATLPATYAAVGPTVTPRLCCSNRDCASAATFSASCRMMALLSGTASVGGNCSALSGQNRAMCSVLWQPKHRASCRRGQLRGWCPEF